MQNYINYVESMAISGKDEFFFNSGSNHAVAVMSRIFKYSEDTVRIFCEGFYESVSNDPDYLMCLEDFMKRGGKLKILAEQDFSGDESLPIFRILKKYVKNVEMFVTTLRVKFNTTNQALHFAIGDRKLVRVEADTGIQTAQVNFGNVQYAESIIRIFDNMFDQNKTTVNLA